MKMSLMVDEIALQSAFQFEPIMDLAEKNFLIKGRYKISKLFFETTHTNIFLGIDLEVRRKVFVHVIKNQFFRQGKDLKAWVKTVQTMRPLKGSDHSFEILDMNLWKKKFFVVTSYFDGVPIFNLLLSKKELPLHFVARVVLNVAQLLQEARQQKLPSRMIGKDDLFVGKDGSIQVLRFNRSRLEVSKDINPETETLDAFFLGSLLFELLTHESPFRKGRTPDSLAKAHFLAILRVRSNQAEKDNFGQICDLFVRSVTLDVDKRIEKISEFCDQLQAVLENSSQIRETLDEKMEMEQLNSAFDVVFALKGKADGERPTQVLDQESATHSRIWHGFDVQEASKWAPDTIFKWVALVLILTSFAYKFLF
jgi:serine/threonine protein kinase